MKIPAQRYFAHRQISDGTYDSICTRCFRTIANDKEESGLLQPEQIHVCAGLSLDDLYYPEKARDGGPGSNP